MACMDFSSGGFDGAKFCVGTDQVAQTTLGAPFSTSPGGVCNSSSNGCQTGLCLTSGTCVRACMANRDCNAGEVCFSQIGGDGNSTGYHVCVASDTQTYLPAGASCSSNGECDSGICNGTCMDHCRTSADCFVGEACLPYATFQSGNERRDYTPVCQPDPSSGSKVLGEACTADSECSSSWCIGGECTSPCGSNNDCTGPLANKTCGAITLTNAQNEPVHSMSFCAY